MNAIEAIKSKKRFRRHNRNDWFDSTTELKAMYFLSQEDLLADDWETEKTGVEITRNQFNEAFNTAIGELQLGGISFFAFDLIERLTSLRDLIAKELKL